MAHLGSRPPESVQGKLFMKDTNMDKVKSDQLGRLQKSTVFVIQKAAEPKNGVEFGHKSIVAIRSSLAML